VPSTPSGGRPGLSPGGTSHPPKTTQQHHKKRKHLTKKPPQLRPSPIAWVSRYRFPTPDSMPRLPSFPFRPSLPPFSFSSSVCVGIHSYFLFTQNDSLPPTPPLPFLYGVVSQSRAFRSLGTTPWLLFPLLRRSDLLQSSTLVQHLPIFLSLIPLFNLLGPLWNPPQCHPFPEGPITRTKTTLFLFPVTSRKQFPQTSIIPKGLPRPLGSASRHFLLS